MAATALAAASAVLSVAGCGGADVRTQTTATTTGQELMDLHKAYDAGAITGREYESKREQILDRD